MLNVVWRQDRCIIDYASDTATSVSAFDTKASQSRPCLRDIVAYSRPVVHPLWEGNKEYTIVPFLQLEAWKHLGKNPWIFFVTVRESCRLNVMAVQCEVSHGVKTSVHVAYIL